MSFIDSAKASGFAARDYARRLICEIRLSSGSCFLGNNSIVVEVRMSLAKKLSEISQQSAKRIPADIAVIMERATNDLRE